jgi:hypothetical protein
MRFTSVLLILMIISVGCFNSWRLFLFKGSTNLNNDRVIEIIKTGKFDCVFYSEYIAPVLVAKIPEIRSNSHSIGWGSFWGHGSDGGVPENVKTIFEDSKIGQKKKFAIVSTSKENIIKYYPSWEKYYNLTEIQQHKAPSIWVGIFSN